MSKETGFTIATSLASTDYFRIVKDGLSRRASPETAASVLQQYLAGDLKIRSTDASGSLVASDDVVLVDCTSGDISQTLPSPSALYDSSTGYSGVLHVVQSVSNSNNLTISPFASEDIYVNGAAASSVVLSGGSSATLVTDGADWFVIG